MIRHLLQRRWVQIALALSVSGGLVATILSKLDLTAAQESLHRGDLRYLALAAGASFSVWVARSLRFYALTQHSGPVQVAAAIGVQNLLNRVAPFRLGELSLPYLLHRRCGEPPAEALITLVLVRVVELWVLLIAVAVAAYTWFGGALSLGPVLVGAIFISLLLLGFRQWLSLGIHILGWMIKRLGLQSMGALSRVLKKLRGVVAENARLTPTQHLALGGGTLAVMALQVVLYYALTRACGVDVGWAQVVVGSSAAQLSGAIPVLSIGSVGTHETGWIAGFMWVGLSLNDALVTGLVSQIVTILFAAVFGLVSWPIIMSTRANTPS